MNSMHDWDVTTERAREIQRALRGDVRREPLESAPEIVAGADVSFARGSDAIFAAAVVLDAENHDVLETSRATGEAVFPYVPSFLSFREAPFVLEAFAALDIDPDVLICDGHGFAHPRRFGLACHVGVLLEVPTIGAAKNVLVGEYDALSPEKGARTPLRHEDDTVGCALRTRANTKPIFVSVGHQIDMEDACETILDVSPRYKIPEPIRAAHAEVNEMRRDADED